MNQRNAKESFFDRSYQPLLRQIIGEPGNVGREMKTANVKQFVGVIFCGQGRIKSRLISVSIIKYEL